MPIKIQIFDANDANVSSASIAVNALKTTRTSATVDGPVQDSGNANPDQNFRYDASLGGTGGYIYNLSTRSLATGTYTLSFQAGSDTSVHTLRFEVK